jgi:hypothetical protein
MTSDVRELAFHLADFLRYFMSMTKAPISSFVHEASRQDGVSPNPRLSPDGSGRLKSEELNNVNRKNNTGYRGLKIRKKNSARGGEEHI